MMKRVAKRLFSLVGVLILLIILLAGYTQTQFFRDQIRSIAFTRLHSVLDAEIFLGEIQGNLVTHLAIDSLSLSVDSVQLLSVGRIELEYDPFTLARKVISIERLSLAHPRIHLETNSDGQWNFSKIVRSAEEDSATAGGFDWKIVLEDLEIENGSFRLLDSAALGDPEHEMSDQRFIEYHDLLVKDIVLALGATVDNSEKQVNIKRLSFLTEPTGFEVRQFAGQIRVGEDQAEIRKLTILTGESSIDLDAMMTGINLLGRIDLSSLEMNPVEVTLRDSDVSLNELSSFIPDIHFLEGVVSTDLEVGGMFGDVQIKKLHLAVGQTSFHVNGSVFNLHRPQDLYLDVQFTDSRISSRDARATLPLFNLPDLESLGVPKFDLTFIGEPVDFRTVVSMESSAGDLDADVELAVGGPNTLEYIGSAQFHDFDLSQLTGESSLSSSLNGALRLDGVGVDFEHLVGSCNLIADSSMFQGNPLSASRFRVDVDRDKVNGVVNMGLGALRTDLKIRLDRMTTELPSFVVSGIISSLDIAELSHEGTHDSDITMTLDARGSGLKWANLSGDFNLDFIASRYQEYQIDSGSVHLFIDQTNPEDKEIRLESSILDLDLTGSFDFQYMLDLIWFERENLNAAIKQKFAAIDSSFQRDQGVDLSEMRASLIERDSRLDASFDLVIKDLEPVSTLTGDRSFNGVGRLRGTVAGDYSNLSIHADLDAEELFYGNVESGFFIGGGTIELELEDLKPVDDPFNDIVIRFFTQAGDLHLNRNQFDSLQAGLYYQNGVAEYFGSGRYSRELGFSIEGQASVSEEALTFRPRDFHLTFRGSDWELSEEAAFQFTSEAAIFENVVLKSDTQEVRIEGIVGTGGELDATFEVDRIGLDLLETFLKNEDGPSQRNVVAGEASMSVVARGTLTNPSLDIALGAREVSFRGLRFGEMDARIDYDDGVASLNLSVADDLDDTDAPPKLSINGVIPFRLPLMDESETVRQIDLSVKSEGLQINFLDPLLPTFDELTGVLRCDLKVLGEPDSLSYHGKFSLDDCRFLFEPNNIRYQFEGDFEPEGDRVRIVNAVARNIFPDDRPERSGELHFSGDFALREFVPTDFNLMARGELLAVRPESRSSSLPVYGELFVETGPAGLHFTGTIKNSLLQGDVLMQRSRLIFPPGTASTARVDAFSVPIIVVDDTTIVPEGDERSFRDRYFLSGTTTQVIEDDGRTGKSFLDGVKYDLNVETTGPSSQIRLVFSEIPVEELEANFQGRWSITDDGTRWIGDLTIDRAQYTFFKQFDATGRLRYSGEFMNPELDIVATYQGTRTVQDPTDSTYRTERVVVTLNIRGTRSAPEQSISMTIDDLDYFSYNGPKSSDVQSDAIAFIIAGHFPLSRTESSTIATDLQTSVGASMVVGASSLLTKQLSDFLRRETGFITSVELGYESQGSFKESADIRLSGTAFKGYWRYRGTILDNPFGNSDVSILYSFGDILDNPNMRNFMFELERRAESGTTPGLIDSHKEVNSARLFYRFSF